jgi:hypothetical protein
MSVGAAADELADGALELALAAGGVEVSLEPLPVLLAELQLVSARTAATASVGIAA